MTFLQDLRFAARMLLKDRWFTVVAATALGLGIGVNTTVFTFVNAVLIRGLPFERADEIVYLATHDTTEGRGRQLGGVVAGVRRLAGQGAVVPGAGGVPVPADEHQRSGAPGRAGERRRRHSQHVFGAEGSSRFSGATSRRVMTSAGAAPVVIIGYSIWKNRYGSDTAVIGRALKINEVAHTIIGIMPEGMRFPTNSDLWRPLTPLTGETRRNRFISVFGRLARGRDLESGRGRDGRHLPCNCRRPIPTPTRTSKRG